MKPNHPLFFLFLQTSHPLLSGVQRMMQILCPHMLWKSLVPTKIRALSLKRAFRNKTMEFLLQPFSLLPGSLLTLQLTLGMEISCSEWNHRDMLLMPACTRLLQDATLSCHSHSFSINAVTFCLF